MKGELKAGGMALVFGLTVNSDGNGKVVSLIELVADGYARAISIIRGDDMPSGYSGAWWRVTGLRPNGGVALVRPQNLMPIDDSDPDSVDELSKDKPVEVTA